MVKQLDAEILQQREFKIYRDTLPVRGTCLRLKDAMYPVDVYINSNGELEVNGDEMDIQNVVKKVKQFYKAVNIARVTGARIQYNKEKRKVRLRMQVR